MFSCVLSIVELATSVLDAIVVDSADVRLVVFVLVAAVVVVLMSEEVVVVFAVVLTTTPGLSVGSVTASADVVFCTVVVLVVVACIVGHSAFRIPPFLIIPSNVFELTFTFEHAFVTLVASAVSVCAQIDEQPASPKSASTQLGIC